MSTIALGELVNLVPGRLLFPHPGMGAMRPLVRRWRSMSWSFNVIRECQDRMDLHLIYKTILGLYLKIKSGRYNTPTCFSLPDSSACAQQVDFFYLYIYLILKLKIIIYILCWALPVLSRWINEKSFCCHCTSDPGPCLLEQHLLHLDRHLLKSTNGG